MSPPRSADETPELPRTQSGANPQHVMAQLLGDFWLDRVDPWAVLTPGTAADLPSWP